MQYLFPTKGPECHSPECRAADEICAILNPAPGGWTFSGLFLCLDHWLAVRSKLLAGSFPVTRNGHMFIQSDRDSISEAGEEPSCVEPGWVCWTGGECACGNSYLTPVVVDSRVYKACDIDPACSALLDLPPSEYAKKAEADRARLLISLYPG